MPNSGGRVRLVPTDNSASASRSHTQGRPSCWKSTFQESCEAPLRKGIQREAGGGQHEAQRDELGLAHFLDEPPDGPALHQRADEAAIDKQVGDGAGRGRIALEVQMEVGADQQGQRAFEAAKAEGGEKEHDDQEAHFGLAERVRPLVEVGTRGGLGGIGPVTFRENEPGQQKIRRAQRRRNPAGAGVAQMLQALAPDERPEDEPQPERHADEAHPLRAVCRRRDVRNVGLGHGDIAAANPGEQPRHHHQPQGGGVVLQARAAREQHVRDRRPRGADEQDGAAAMAVGQSAPDRREDELHRRERGKDERR